MNSFFPEIKKNFGFGCMRLPMTGDRIDLEQTKQMVDAFLEAGFNYFDTARPYHKGMSESALRQCLTSRYPRESYLLADKLSFTQFETEEEVLPLFYQQLADCGVEYFDFYLFHAMSAARLEKHDKCNTFSIVRRLKEEGKIRHIGMSFHDNAAVLDEILTAHPEMEFVQIQFNYADYEDPKVESRKCYEVCRKHNKAVMIMEPVKGGSLVNLPAEALQMMTENPAGYAIRYAAGFEGVVMVLSGMSNMEQMQDNLSTMKDFKPLTPAEQEMIGKVRTLYQAQHRIPCTGCRYCTENCPAEIKIPEIFDSLNKKQAGESYNSLEELGGNPCLDCGTCEAACPQHLQIRTLLKQMEKVLI